MSERQCGIMCGGWAAAAIVYAIQAISANPTGCLWRLLVSLITALVALFFWSEADVAARLMRERDEA